MQQASASERTEPSEASEPNPQRSQTPGGAGDGSTICGWRLRRFLGGGPLCASWFAERGRDRALVRVLRAPFANLPQLRAEWLRGNWAANRFYHPRVPAVVQEGVDARGAPVVMRLWADGEPLDAVVGRGVLEPPAALRLFERLLDALEMAHAHGVVHGAITPSNLIVTPGGSLRLVDFAVPPGVRPRRPSGVDLLARARGFAFTAPEWRTGAEAAVPSGPGERGEPGEQRDLWAVGACLRFALTGAAPDLAGDPCAGLGGNLPADVVAVTGMALARDPLRRYDTAYSMLGDVRRVLAGRRPKLQAASGPVPSSLVAVPDDLASSPGRHSDGGASAPALAVPAEADEWKGNLVLMVAIALLVGLATFVVVREKLADRPETHQAP
jgi:serine/threonine-protein kinase